MTVGRWGAATALGRIRSVNEDSYVASPPVFVVADGMGGHAAGDIASRIAADEFETLAGLHSVVVDEALAAIDRANEAILNAAGRDQTRVGMGTTVTGLISVVAAGIDHWIVFNIGDSRVYRLDGGRLEQLTTDHSEAEEMVASGRITREEARSYGRRNVVTRSLGTSPSPVPDSWVFPPRTADRFILCSDGLTLELHDVEIEARANVISSPQLLAQDLVDRAVAAGGRDNVTVIVVDGPNTFDNSDVDENTAPRAIPLEGY